MNYSTSFYRMISYFHKSDGCRISNMLLNCDTFLTNDFCDYITTRGELLSYLPKGKQHKVNDDGKWAREGRQEAKPAKLIKKIIIESVINDFMITDKEFEMFANNVKAYVLTNGDGDSDKTDAVNIVVCNGEFINLYYDSSSYADMPECNLTGSCMRKMDDGTFDIYSQNTEQVSMVVAINGLHQVLGRALLWKTDNNGYCMDTIYAQDKIRAVMIKFAREMGFHYKSQQSCHHNNFDMFDGVCVGNKNVIVSLTDGDFSDYPYLDTMSYLDMSNDKLMNNPWSGEHRVLRCTGGSYETSNSTVYDDWSGDDIDEDDARYVDYRLPTGDRFCGHTHFDNLCEVDNYGYVIQDHAIWSDHLREWIVDDSDYWLYSDRDSRWYYTDDCVTDYNGDVIHENDSVVLCSGDYAHGDDAVELSDGTYELSSDCVLVDGVYVLKSNINNDNQ